MKHFIKQVFSLQFLVSKPLIVLLITAGCGLWTEINAQYRQDRSIIRGNVTSITIKYPGDITTDSLFFQVRTTSSFTSTIHIAKENTVAGGSDAEILATYSYPYTTVKIFFSSANTSGLAIANYYYDLRKSVSPDFEVLIYGTFKIQSYAGEVVNGLAGGGSNESIIKSWIGDSADVIRMELADYVLENDLSDSLDNIRTLIGTGGVALPDSVLFSTDSTAQRTFSDLKYATKAQLSALQGEVDAIPIVSIDYPDANTIQIASGQAIHLDPATLEINGSNQLTVVGGVGGADSSIFSTKYNTEKTTKDSLYDRMGAVLDIDDLAVVKDYEPVIADSSILLYKDGVWQIWDLGSALQSLVVGTPTLPDSIVYTSEISGKASTTLNNLGTTSINANLIPDTDNLRYLGSASEAWTLAYINALTLTRNGYGVTVGLTGVLTQQSNLYFPRNVNGTMALGTGTANQLAYWVGTNTLGSLTTSTYPTLTELAYIKGVTSNIQTQLDSKLAFTDTSVVNALIEANEDSSGSAIIGTTETLDSIITDYWNDALGGSTIDTAIVNALIEANEDTSGSAIIGTTETLDSLITDYWNDNLGGGGTPFDSTYAYQRITALEDSITAFRSILNSILAALDDKLDKSLLAGGTTDQVLAKIDGDDYNFTWATIEAGEPVFPPDETPPSPPTGLNATATDESSITLNWTDPADGDLDSIRIYEYKNATEDSTAMTWIASVGAGVETYNRTGLDAETTYWYRLKAMDDSGNVSYFSNVDSATTLATGGATPFYTLDFEEGDLSEWSSTSGANLSASTTFAHSGTYSMRVGTNSFGIYSYTATDTIWATFEIYLPSTSSQNASYNFIAMFNNGIDDRTVFGTNQNGGATWGEWLAGINSGNMTDGDFTTNFSQNAWHTVKMKYTTNGTTTSTHQVWVDGTSIWSTTGAFVNNASNFTVGSEAATITGYFYIDDINLYLTDPDL